MKNRVALITGAALLAGAALYGLSGCEPHGPPLTSDCRGGETIRLTVHILPSQIAVKELGESFGIELEKRDKLLGFATQGPAADKHDLFVTLPRGQNDHQTIETWGHELMHAVCGPWHPVG